VSGTTATFSGLTGGVTYKFKIAGINKYDTGVFSSVLAVVAAEPPQALDAPVVTLEGLYVKIAWTALSDNNASILSYKVLIEDKDGSYIEDVNACDGSSATVLANEYCLVDMDKFWVAPFELQQRTLVSAKVIAINERGSSTESPANTAGTLVETVPHQMNAPTQGVDTDYQRVHLDWDTVIAPENGDSDVVSYIIYWDQGTGDDVDFVELIGETSAFTLSTYTITSGLVTGGTYRFKVKAVNKWGTGDLFSDTVSVLVASAPAQILSATTSIDPLTGGVVIDWIAPDPRG